MKRVLAVIAIILILIVIGYATYVKYGDKILNINLFGINLSGSNNNLLVCTQTTNESGARATTKTELTFENNKLQKDVTTIDIVALTDEGKTNLAFSKAMMEAMESSMKSFDGISIETKDSDSKFTYTQTTDYAALNQQQISDAEASGGLTPTFDYQYNQSKADVKAIAESQGLTCK